MATRKQPVQYLLRLYPEQSEEERAIAAWLEEIGASYGVKREAIVAALYRGIHDGSGGTLTAADLAQIEAVVETVVSRHAHAEVAGEARRS